MKTIRVLLFRELLEIKRNFPLFLIIFTIFPMTLYLFIVLPLSNIFSLIPIESNLLGIRYLNWSSVGVWITSSCLLAFIFSLSKIKKIKYDSSQLNILLGAPTSNTQIIFSIIISAFIIGFIQSVISIIITTLFNNQIISSTQFLLIFFQLILLVLFFSILGIFLGQYVNTNIKLIFISVILFLIICFGLGTFFPITVFSSSFSYVESFPVAGLINNCQLILSNEPVVWLDVSFTLIINIALCVIVIIMSHKSFRK